MDELDGTVAWLCARGPQPLPLDGWDQASIWGWDAIKGSLYARLWRNPDNPSGPQDIRIEPGDYTPTITVLPTLAQYIAMAVDCNPWRVLTILDRAAEQAEDEKHRDAAGDKAGTVVTMTEGHTIWWPPNFGQ